MATPRWYIVSPMRMAKIGGALIRCVPPLTKAGPATILLTFRLGGKAAAISASRLVMCVFALAIRAFASSRDGLGPLVLGMMSYSVFLIAWQLQDSELRGGCDGCPAVIR